MLQDDTVYEIKLLYGFADLQGNHWPRWSNDWTWDEIQEIYRGVSTPVFAKLSEKFADPKIYPDGWTRAE